MGRKARISGRQPPPPPIETTDRDALEALYEAVDGEDWTENSNWLTNAPLNRWHGVTTNRSGRVIELDLSENELSGAIPAELGDLTFLESLNLSKNQLRGDIPPELGNLSNLRALALFDNNLRGPIPPDVALLANLRWLVLLHNELTGSIPPELGRLEKLEWLYLWGNQLSGEIPPELGTLTNLERLGLSYNNLTGTIPLELESLTGLEALFLSENRFSGCIPEVWRYVEENDLEDANIAICSDWEALAALYEAADGDDWLENENWLSDAPLGTWFGVTTDEDDRVIALELVENELRGTIPPDLAHLTRLEQLILSRNRLSGTIPAWLGELDELAKLVLALSGNRLSGTIPAWLGELDELVVLALSGNRLSGAIPAELGNLVKLEMLALAENRLTGTIPPALDRLTRLGWLYLADNELDGCVPEVWTDVEENDRDAAALPICTDRDALVALYAATDGDNWVNNENWLSNAPLDRWHGVSTDGDERVTDLELFENELRGTIPPELGRLANLTRLILFDNELRGEIPPALGNLANLERLYLSNNNLRGEIPVELADLRQLEHLILWGNSLSGTVPPELGRLANLVHLSLSTNKLSGPIPQQVGKLTRLAALSLWGNRLSGEIPAELGNLTRLMWLSLAQNDLSGEIPTAMGNLAQLEELYLADNRWDGCLPAVWEDVEENDLEELDLPFCTLVAASAGAGGGSLDSAQIFASVAPAIAYIRTWGGSGSGVLIEGGYIVTNAHVVWPYNAAARVYFPAGPDLRNVPVIGWDLLTDLAVLGPVDVDVQPARMLDGEGLSTGSELYLIGYPAEVEDYPETTMTRGILSRLREWEEVGITFFQTDASITGGQSGGALVSESGAVVGISGFKAFVEFGLAASSADLLPRIEQLIAGRDPSGLGERRLALGSGLVRHRITPRDYGDAYILHEPAGTRFEVNFGGHEVRLTVVDEYGNVLGEGVGGSYSQITRRGGPLFLIFDDIPAEFTLSSSHRLLRFDDPERGQAIGVGQTLYGNIDYPTDVDYFFLELERGEKVALEGRSILANLRLDVRGYRDERLAFWVTDTISGGGLFGGDARIVFEAPFAGDYILHVENVHTRSHAPAGYMLAVAPAGRTDRLTPLQPLVSITTPVNVRAGPGTGYAVMGTAAPGEWYRITGKNSGDDWWQINYNGRSGWLYAPLVTAINAEGVEVVASPRQ